MLLGGIYFWLDSEAETTLQQRRLASPALEISLEKATELTASELEAYLEEAASAMAALHIWEEEDKKATPPTTTVATPEAPEFSVAPINKNMLEATAFGPLPKKYNNESPWQYYRHPTTWNGKQPAIAIFIEGLGLREEALQQTIETLPPQIGLVFTPYTQRLDIIMESVRQKGFEVYLSLPMEPNNYPQNDPGIRALMKKNTTQQNMDALYWILGRSSGYVGVVTLLGDAFTEQAWRIDPVLQELGQRGVLFADASSDTGRQTTAPRATQHNTAYVPVRARLDAVPTKQAILDILKTAAAASKQGQRVTLIASPYPVTLTTLTEWFASEEAAEIMLVPPSAFASIK